MLRLTQRTGNTQAWPRPDDIPPILYELLVKRGIPDEASARAFLCPSLDALHDPFLLSDMDKAVSAIRQAVDGKQKICVYGDYDVDGVCACAVLTEYLRSVGARAEAYLPSRHAEGYGLNEAAVTQIAGEYGLLITVDCGITSRALIALARSLGLDCVVTDHHRPEGALPDCPTVNPLLNEYPFPSLCGAGVAFKLITALGGLDAAMEYIDFAALATIADIVPLMDENRVIAHMGVKKINASPRPGVRALIDVSGLSGKTISAGNIAFQMTPRLNASGRIGDAMRAYRLLTETNLDECFRIADALDEENTLRRQYEQETLSEIEETLQNFDFPAHRAIVVAGEGWNPGVIGLAASRLTEKYHYPSIVMTREGDMLTGSCRSIDGVDIHDALSNLSQYLVRFGGHRLAAGLTMRAEDMDAFARALDAYLQKAIPPATYIPVAQYDMAVSARDLDANTVAALNVMSPTGCGNPAPVFRVDGRVENARAVGANGAHLKLTVRDESGALEGIWFRYGSLASSVGGQYSVLFTAGLNSFMGRVSVQAELRALSEAKPEDALAALDSRADALFARFLMDAPLDGRAGADAIDADALSSRLARAWQGVLLIALTPAGARRALMLSAAPLDLYIGAYPKDPRCFSAVCLCPVGRAPAGYRQIVLIDAPEGLTHATHILTGAQTADPGFAQVPNVDCLRALFLAAREICKKPARFETAWDVAEELSDMTGISRSSAAAGARVLCDMRLIRIDSSPGRAILSVPACGKADPQNNPLYQTLNAYKRAYACEKGGVSHDGEAG